MTTKERDQLSRDIHFRIMCLNSDENHALLASEVKLEVEHGIMPIIVRAMDKVVRRTQDGEIELADGKGVRRHNG